MLSGRMALVHSKPDGEKVSNANGLYIHHAFFYDASKPPRSSLACPGTGANISAFNYLMAEGADTAGLKYPDNYTIGNPIMGTWVEKGSRILINGDVVNYNPEARDVYMVADIQYVEGRRTSLLEPAMHLVTVGSCESNGGIADLILHPPADKKQWTIKGDTVVKEDSRLLGIRGHLHDGGVNLLIKINGQVVCDSLAIYQNEAVGTNAGSHGNADPMGTPGGMSNMISDMVTCWEPREVTKGDKLYLEANYDLDKHTVRVQPGGGSAEVMAIMALLFAKEVK